MAKDLRKQIVLSPKAHVYLQEIFSRRGVENPTAEQMSDGITRLLKEVRQHSSDATSNLSGATNRAFGQPSRPW
jgi:hypothetical protein